jgi:hypothetical protein
MEYKEHGFELLREAVTDKYTEDDLILFGVKQHD